MNLLKSFFVSAFVAADAWLAVLSCGHLVTDGITLGWLGAALATVPFLILLGVLYATTGVARTSSRLPLIIALGGIGVLMAAVESSTMGGIEPALYPAAAGFAMFLLYSYWYSSLGHRHSPALAVGAPLPDVQLKRTDGRTVSSDDFRGRPTVMIFYRGNWCPLCMAQIKEIAAQYRELAARGARVALVSPQSAAKSAALAARFDAPLEFYVDQGNAAAKAMGIFHRGGLPFGLQIFGYQTDTVMPTVVITGADGRILFADQTDNYRVRPEPATFLKVLDAAGPPQPAPAAV